MKPRHHLYFLTRKDKNGSEYIDLQLRVDEFAAIGHVTTQWAFLEFAILRETKSLARHLDIALPEDAEAVSFKRRRRAWEALSRKALVEFPEELSRSVDCIERAKNLANERHRITHDVIEYDKGDENRLKAFPRESLGKFGMPLDVARIEQLARNIARLNYDLLAIHRDPEPAPDASLRTQDKQDRRDPPPHDGSPRHRPASRKSPSRQR